MKRSDSNSFSTTFHIFDEIYITGQGSDFKRSRKNKDLVSSLLLPLLFSSIPLSLFPISLVQINTFSLLEILKIAFSSSSLSLPPIHPSPHSYTHPFIHPPTRLATLPSSAKLCIPRKNTFSRVVCAELVRKSGGTSLLRAEEEKFLKPMATKFSSAIIYDSIDRFFFPCVSREHLKLKMNNK